MIPANIPQRSLKCRAIIPLNRTGAEPYFETSFPPNNCWVDSGFFIESMLTECKDPLSYFTRATYIPFATLKQIAFEVDSSRLGITQIHVNDSEQPTGYSVAFTEPPKALKFIICGLRIGFRYPFLQVSPVIHADVGNYSNINSLRSRSSGNLLSHLIALSSVRSWWTMLLESGGEGLSDGHLYTLALLFLGKQI